MCELWKFIVLILLLYLFHKFYIDMDLVSKIKLKVYDKKSACCYRAVPYNTKKSTDFFMQPADLIR